MGEEEHGRGRAEPRSGELELELRPLSEILESERRLRVLAEMTNDYCYAVELRGAQSSCVWMTEGAERLTGYRSEELSQHPPWHWVHEEDRAAVSYVLGRVRGGESVVHEYRLLSRDGPTRWVREHLHPELDGRGEGLVYAAVRDVTDRHRAHEEQQLLEAQLRQSQKMDAIGRLAGGIAHDFNNLLTVILTHCGFVLSELTPSSQAHDDARDIQSAAKRAAQLTQRLLAFSRQQVLTPTVLDINGVVRDLEPMLSSLLGEGIDLEVMLHPGVARTKVDRAQLEQIILNLVVNARDAMPQGGKVQLMTGSVALGPDYLRSHPEASEGEHVALGVRDTGTGMSGEVLARIFEPFFTTKEQGKGTGLGLSTVYGIVKQTGGSIHVESEVGFGSTFEVFLPVAAEAATLPASVRPSSDRAAKQGTILIVEDEEGVRRGVQRILSHAGYQVLVAADPAQAIAIVEDFQGAIDLLLTDVVMPMMNGVQLAQRVVAMRDGIKVLYMSGHAREGLDEHRPSALEFLQKPFSRQAMLAKVDQVLGQD